MNLLQVTPYDVYPPIDGAPHRSHGLVSTFATEGDEVRRFCQRGPASRVFKLYRNGKQFSADRLAQQVTISNGYSETRSKNPLDDLVSLPGLAGYPQFLLDTSLTLYTPARLTELLNWADVVMIEKPWQFPAIDSLCDDTPVLYSSHDVVTELYEEVRAKPFGEQVYNRVRNLEEQAVQSANMVICTSDRDRALLEDAYEPEGNIFVAPNAVDGSTIRESPTEEQEYDSIKTELDIPTEVPVGLFVGGRHGPNNDAVKQLKTIAEALRGADDSFHILIVGSAGSTLENTPSNLTATGYVSELEPYFDVADMGLNPVEWGGGTNIKMIDYFARGLPVITTEFGTRGFDLTPGEEALVGDTSDFPEMIQHLLTNPELRRELGANGLNFVRNKYVWEAVSQSLRKQIVAKFDV